MENSLVSKYSSKIIYTRRPSHYARSGLDQTNLLWTVTSAKRNGAVNIFDNCGKATVKDT